MNGTGLWRGSRAQTLRLVSGLVLFAFAAAHFLNHALGLISLEAMSRFDDWRVAVDRSPPGSAVLLAAALVHTGLGLRSALARRSWARPAWEWIQVVTGLFIPILLLPHIINTRFAATLFGVRDTYAYELARLWPDGLLAQGALLLIVWVHGCVGLHFWLRLSPVYLRLQPLLYAVAVLLPFAALAGASVQGRAIEHVMADPARAAELRAATNWPDAGTTRALESGREAARWTYIVILACLAVAIAGGSAIARRRRRIPVQYAGGPLVWTEPGLTLLDVSRRTGQPHQSVCGGRGRCSTCRVLVLSKGAPLSPPTDAEQRTLRAIGAGPNVRLACQTVARGPVTILPLLKSGPAGGPRPFEPADDAGGVERELAVLFVDLRGFTALTERKLPFDIIYILNQFFTAVGEPIQEAGGWIANYAGDGLIALFNDETGIAAACGAALRAVIAIDQAVELLSGRLMEETHTPLAVAMGLHAGPHVMGRVGFGSLQPVSVVGLAVNVASRLETLAKQQNVQLALSGTVAQHGGLVSAGLQKAPIEVRGLSEPLEIIFVGRARELVGRLERAGATAGSLAAAAAS